MTNKELEQELVRLKDQTNWRQFILDELNSLQEKLYLCERKDHEDK